MEIVKEKMDEITKTSAIGAIFVVIILAMFMSLHFWLERNNQKYAFSEYQVKHGLYITQEILENGGLLGSNSFEFVLYMHDGNETKKAIITTHNKSFDQLSDDFAKAQENYKKLHMDGSR